MICKGPDLTIATLRTLDAQNLGLQARAASTAKRSATLHSYYYYIQTAAAQVSA
jgi:hypothetical protein